jgi:hypothetical protein
VRYKYYSPATLSSSFFAGGASTRLRGESAAGREQQPPHPSAQGRHPLPKGEGRVVGMGDIVFPTTPRGEGRVLRRRIRILQPSPQGEGGPQGQVRGQFAHDNQRRRPYRLRLMCMAHLIECRIVA